MTAHHCSPGGEGTSSRYFYGTEFNTKTFAIKEIIKELMTKIK